MAFLRSFIVSVLLIMAGPTGLSGIAHGQGYDAEAPCGRDEQGYPLQCYQEPAPSNLEAACLTLARVENCLPYHYNACNKGFAVACQIYQIGANCNGGDPQACTYYRSLLEANRACALDSNQQACTWIRQQGY